MSAYSDAVADLLTGEIVAIRKRRDTFERMGADDAARNAQCDLELISGIAAKILNLSIRERADAAQ